MCGPQESGNTCVNQSQTHFARRRDDKNDQGNPEFANLLDDTLCRTIWPSRDDPVVSPSDIEYTTPGLQNIKYKKGKL
jgi:hypothetical protein